MKLSTEQLTRLSRLLDEVVDLDEAGRMQWLHSLAPEYGDLEPALRGALFPRAAGAGERQAVVALLENGARAAARVASGLHAGQMVGPYRLMRPLAAGGMAEVWLAQRADGAFKREVALKIPVRADQREHVARRFVVERDILAALEHPNIARFYDAGVSEDGRPYLALEYVAGTHLLQWADAHRLGVRERIELFLQVLDAVQYAHDKGVLHRDIKPGNVLVTEAGQVRLLDFGVARLMERPAEADLTREYGRALTPAYASPEQIEAGPVDAASDVYSLGVVLYQLLSGRRPYEVAGPALQPDRAVLPPSARLDADAAQVRGGSLARIARALTGDLEAIVLKALSRSPSDRYPSAVALARDLRRHVAGEAVEAVPASLRYRAGKVLARNRVGVAAAVGVAVVFVALGYPLALRQPAPAAPATSVEAAAPATPVAQGAAEDKSIAVLPFADMSEQRDQEHFSDGLSEELIERLARSRNLRVIARTSAFAFKGRNEDVRSIAAKLGVAYLLTGSVRRNDRVLRVTAQLVRAADGTQLWSQTYDRRLADVFKVQDEIAETVARALETALADRGGHPAVREPDVDAYNLVLQGEVYTNGPFRRDAERAEALFRKAASIDPDYALPWVKLGHLYMREAYLSWMPKEEGHAQARQAIDTALRMAPDLMAARAARFRYLVRVEFRWGEARAELARMRAIDPYDAAHLPDCEAYLASVLGNLDEAIRIQTQVAHRDPLNSSAIGTLAFYLFQADRLEDASALFRRQLQMNPHAIGNHGFIGVALALLGRGEQALEEIARERHEGYRRWASAIAYSALGRKREADAALEGLKQQGRENAYYVAQVHALRGERNPAFEWLNRACAQRQSGCENVRSDRFLRDLRDDPRYRALLARMKLDSDALPPVP